MRRNFRPPPPVPRRKKIPDETCRDNVHYSLDGASSSVCSCSGNYDAFFADYHHTSGGGEAQEREGNQRASEEACLRPSTCPLLTSNRKRTTIASGAVAR